MHHKFAILITIDFMASPPDIVRQLMAVSAALAQFGYTFFPVGADPPQEEYQKPLQIGD
jgi:hypothetical protein